MDNTVNKRLKELIFFLNLNTTEFSKQLGYKSAEKISRLIRSGEEKSKPSFDILLDITNKFDFVNIEWLINGNGKMLKSENLDIQNKNIVQSGNGVGNKITINGENNKENPNVDNSILEKDKEIKHLKEQLKLKDKIIQLLERK